MWGTELSERGIETDDSKIKVWGEWPTPGTVTKVRNFLGLTNYYCWLIHKYAQVAEALYYQILPENMSKKNKAVVWDGDYGEAFSNLK